MLGGLSKNQHQFILDVIKKPLTEKCAQLWLFGSRARGDHSDYSDVDLLIEGDVSHRDIGQLQEVIENSNFPYKVDLVIQRELAESYIANVYRDRVPFD